MSLAGFAVPTILLVITTPLLLRRMGTTEYGLWAISIGAFGLVGVLELGIGTTLAKYVAEHSGKRDVPSLSGTATIAFGAYLLLGLALTPVLFVSAGWIAGAFSSWDEPHRRVETVVKLVSLGILPLLLQSGGLAIAVGLQRFEVPMAAALAQSGLTLLAAVAVVYAGGSVTSVVLSSLAVLWLTAAASLTFGVRALLRLGVRPVFRPEDAHRTLHYMSATGAAGLGMAFFGSADRVAVGAVLGLRAVAYYTVSIGIASKILAFADVVSRPLLPAASAQVAVGDPLAVRMRLLRWTWAIGIASALLATTLFVVSAPLLRIWAGAPFADHALPTFRILLIVYGLIALAAPAHHTANGAGAPWICAATALAGGAGTLALIALLGSPLGVAGAAVANAAYLVNLAIPPYISRRLRRRDLRAPLWSPAD